MVAKATAVGMAIAALTLLSLSGGALYFMNNGGKYVGGLNTTNLASLLNKRRSKLNLRKNLKKMNLPVNMYNLKFDQNHCDHELSQSCDGTPCFDKTKDNCTKDDVDNAVCEDWGKWLHNEDHPFTQEEGCPLHNTPMVDSKGKHWDIMDCVHDTTGFINTVCKKTCCSHIRGTVWESEAKMLECHACDSNPDPFKPVS